MGFDCLVVIARDAVNHVDQCGDLDVDVGFFLDFPDTGLAYGFAQFLQAAGDAPLSEPWRFAPFDQQKLISSPNDDTDADTGVIEIGPAVVSVFLG